ncbi:2-component regulator [Chlamydia pneumoniae B21]|nr:2-component regulator [Chlamydia pneumoniae B21]
MAIKNILVVDDEPLLRDFLSELLTSQGFIPDTAENLRNALQMIRTRDYDLVISDMSMPDGSGLDLIKIIKQSSPPHARPCSHCLRKHRERRRGYAPRGIQLLNKTFFF